jgi:hypothetical protein
MYHRIPFLAFVVIFFLTSPIVINETFAQTTVVGKRYEVNVGIEVSSTKINDYYRRWADRLNSRYAFFKWINSREVSKDCDMYEFALHIPTPYKNIFCSPQNMAALRDHISYEEHCSVAIDAQGDKRMFAQTRCLNILGDNELLAIGPEGQHLEKEKLVSYLFPPYDVIWPHRLSVQFAGYRDWRDPTLVLKETDNTGLHWGIENPAWPITIQGEVFIFVPEKDTIDRLGIVARWRALAASGEPFDCDGSNCWVIVNSFSKQSPQNLMSLCQVVKTKSGISQPESCVPLMTEIGDERYIVVEVASVPVPTAKGRPDFNLSINFKGQMKQDEIYTEIAKSLSNGPLSLSTETHTNQNYILATADDRASAVLRGSWRESITVRADVGPGDGGVGADTGITISTTIYVNPQNTARPSDWSLPNAEQEKAFIREIRNQLTGEFGKLCAKTDWQGNVVLNCEWHPPRQPVSLRPAGLAKPSQN